jgi:hypothetical protein
MSRYGNRGSILAGFLWMLVLSIVLFWLPLLGPLIAGFVGGKAAGSPGRAFVAALLPAIVVAVCVFILSLLTFLPFVGILVGGGLVVSAAAHSVPLLIGALIGGATAS